MTGRADGRDVRRRLTLSLIALLALAGTAAARNPHDPQRRFTKADQAWAKKLVVTRADLTGAGWTAERTSSNATCRSFNPDESDLIETGERESPGFSRNGSFVASMAAVFRSSAHAQSAWAREIRPALLKCLAEGLDMSSTPGTSVAIVSQGRMAFTKLAPRTAAFKVRLVFTVQTFTLRADVHVIALGRGRANLMLVTMSPGRPLSPLPVGLERTLAQRLAQRLRG